MSTAMQPGGRQTSRATGLLISFEGIDASGKNTQSKLLFDELKSRGFPSELLSFPDYETAIGHEIHAFLSKKKDYSLEARHILYTANRYEHKARIEESVRSKSMIVVVNRYTHSNIAYGVANGLPFEWLRALESRMPEPDYVFLLRADPKLSERRKKIDLDIYEANIALLRRASAVYNELVDPKKWFVVEADRPVGMIRYEIWKITENLLGVE